jgi:hypothetical protein
MKTIKEFFTPKQKLTSEKLDARKNSIAESSYTDSEQSSNSSDLESSLKPITKGNIKSFVQSLKPELVNAALNGLKGKFEQGNYTQTKAFFGMLKHGNISASASLGLSLRGLEQTEILLTLISNGLLIELVPFLVENHEALLKTTLDHSATKAIIAHNIDAKKYNHLNAVKALNEQIEKELVSSNKKNLKSQLKKLEKDSSNLSITPLDETSFDLRNLLDIKPEGSITDIINVAQPIIKALFSHGTELTDLSNSFSLYIMNPENAEHLVETINSSMQLLRKDNILTLLTDIPNLTKALDQLAFTDQNAAINKALGAVKGKEDAIVKAIRLVLPNTLDYALELINRHPTEIKILAEQFQTYNNATEDNKKTSLSDLINTAIDLFPQIKDTVLDSMTLNFIASQALDSNEITTLLKLEPNQTQALKLLAPHIISSTKNITAAALNHPTEIKKLAEQFQTYNNAEEENKQKTLSDLIKDGIALSQKPEMIDSIGKFIDETLKEPDLPNTISQLINSNALKALTVEQKYLANEVINIACKAENQTYLTTITKNILAQPELNKLVSNVINYRSAESKNKAESLNKVISSGLDLLAQPRVYESIFKKEQLKQIIDAALTSPQIYNKLESITQLFKEDKSGLIEAISTVVPNLINGLNNTLQSTTETVEIVRAQAILAKAATIAAGIHQDQTAAWQNLAHDVLATYQEIDHSSLNKHLETNKSYIAEAIDKGLSSLKKDTKALKILKPLGINGEFVIKILQKVNNPEGAKLVSSIANNPSKSNIAWQIICSPKLTGFIISHAANSFKDYLLQPKSQAKEDIKTDKSALNSLNSTSKQEFDSITENIAPHLETRQRTKSEPIIPYVKKENRNRSSSEPTIPSR